MLANHFQIAWRNLVKNKFYSAINIGGFSFGLCICLLITLYVSHERSYDKFHRNADRIYAISGHVKLNSDTVQFALMSYPTGPLVMSSTLSVEGFLRMQHPHQPVTIQNPDLPERKFQENNCSFADSNFFRFFSFRLLQGNPDQALKRPFTMVITERIAKKYFGDKNPIGQLLKYDNDKTFEITGVSENPPSNSEISYDLLASLSSRRSIKGGEYMFNQPNVSYGDFRTYLLLKDKALPSAVQPVLQKLSEQDKNAGGVQGWYYLTALGDVHLEKNIGFDAGTKYLTIFSLVAVLILFLALANYMSLTTARATLRAKEIGIRKVAGAARSTLILQFYIESALYILLAFLLGSGFFLLVRPWFFSLLQFPIDGAFILTPSFLFSIAGLFLFSVLVSGSYPSLILSSYKPVATLHGKQGRHNGGVGVRNLFTIVQFTISIALIVCSIIITQQLYYFRHAGNGVNRQNIMMIGFGPEMAQHYQAFKKEISSLPGVERTATAHYPFYHSYDILSANLNEKDNMVALHAFKVDSQFIPLLNLQWKIRPLTSSLLPGSNYIVINEAAIGKLGLPANPVGRRMRIMGTDEYEIVGVLNDFNYSSMRSKIDAACLIIQTNTGGGWSSNGCLFIKIGAHVIYPTLADAVKKIYEQYDKSRAFDYEFMDDAFNAMYKAEERLAGVVDILTIITSVIACLGLLGLAAFSATQKVKEIGIRKVLGASSESITRLLLKKLIRQVLLSILIATPIAWYLMDKWLQYFPYRITIAWWVFVLSGMGAVVIALITVGGLTLKAAGTNPIRSLRTD